MSNRVEGVTEKLIESATREFLRHGYDKASMRFISEEAGTTPRSIYTRYGDKEGLFAALVENTAYELKVMFEKYMAEYNERPVDERRQLFHDEDFAAEYQNYMETIVGYMYSHLTEMKLLICCSAGTKYESFIDELVDINEKYTLIYIDHTKNDVLSSGRATPVFIHLLCSSFMYGFFEVIRHDMSREDALRHIEQLQVFYSKGWDNLFNPEN